MAIVVMTVVETFLSTFLSTFLLTLVQKRFILTRFAATTFEIMTLLTTCVVVTFV